MKPSIRDDLEKDWFGRVFAFWIGDAEMTPARRTCLAILSENDISEDSISIIWMDIEGAEPDVCKSMENLLKRRVPMMMEYSPRFYGPDETGNFVAFLSGFYEKCIVFDDRKRGKKGRKEIDVSDLPLSGKQLNVLFLP